MNSMGGMILKTQVGGIEENAGVGFVAGIDVNKCNRDSMHTANFHVQAAGIGRLADASSPPSNSHRNDRSRNIEFACDPSRIQVARLGIEQSRLDCPYSMGSVF